MARAKKPPHSYQKHWHYKPLPGNGFFMRNFRKPSKGPDRFPDFIGLMTAPDHDLKAGQAYRVSGWYNPGVLSSNGTQYFLMNFKITELPAQPEPVNAEIIRRAIDKSEKMKRKVPVKPKIT